MNYFEIINAVLIEMNYSPVVNFSNLTEVEHKRLMSIINRLNKEICNLSDKFYFRQMVKKLYLYPDKIEYNISISGKVDKILGTSREYLFEPDYAKFFVGDNKPYTYSVYGEKYLFAPNEEYVKIFYSTNLFVKGQDGNVKSDFEKETDISIIPENFVEKLFINGCAYNFNQNTSHPKYIHWKTMYAEAVNELISTAKKITNINSFIDGGFRKL